MILRVRGKNGAHPLYLIPLLFLLDRSLILLSLILLQQLPLKTELLYLHAKVPFREINIFIYLLFIGVTFYTTATTPNGKETEQQQAIKKEKELEKKPSRRERDSASKPLPPVPQRKSPPLPPLPQQKEKPKEEKPVYKIAAKPPPAPSYRLSKKFAAPQFNRDRSSKKNCKLTPINVFDTEEDEAMNEMFFRARISELRKVFDNPAATASNSALNLKAPASTIEYKPLPTPPKGDLSIFSNRELSICCRMCRSSA